MILSNNNGKLGIFASIDGEVNARHQGRITVFVRLAGCNLYTPETGGCSYCDTHYALDKKTGVETTWQGVAERVMRYGINKVTITGGEPLIQKTTVDLARFFVNKNLDVSIETNGSIRPPFISSLINWIMDYKLPSGMEKKMKIQNFVDLKPWDFIKFVIFDAVDFARALEVIEELKKHMSRSPQFAFSPIHGRVQPKVLVNWMIEKKVDAVLNLQLHKIIELQEDA